MKKLRKIFSCIFGSLMISSMCFHKVNAKPIVCDFDTETGINVLTNEFYGPDGYDMDGYKIKFIPDPDDPWNDDDPAYGAFSSGNAVFLLDGKYDFENGYTRRGFNWRWIHKDTGTKYDPEGYDVNGFDKRGIHRDTHTKWSPFGFDVDGFRGDKFNAFTLSYRGLDGKIRY